MKGNFKKILLGASYYSYWFSHLVICLLCSCSVLSDSLQPLAAPRAVGCQASLSTGFPRTEYCHFLLQGIFPTQGSNPRLLHCRQVFFITEPAGKPQVICLYCYYYYYFSLSRVWLFVTPWAVAYQAPPSMGFSRQEYWSGLPFSFSRGSSQPRDRTRVSCIPGRRFNLWATREALSLVVIKQLEWSKIQSSRCSLSLPFLKLFCWPIINCTYLSYDLIGFDIYIISTIGFENILISAKSLCMPLCHASLLLPFPQFRIYNICNPYMKQFEHQHK